jgi:hypothetical protein
MPPHAETNHHLYQVWQGDYGDRTGFLAAVHEINRAYDSDLVTGLSLLWSDIPYALTLLAVIVIDGNESAAESAATSISDRMRTAGASLRPDLTGAQISQAISQRQLNSVGLVKGLPEIDPCSFATRTQLRENGFDFKDWSASQRLFLSHQNSRRPNVALLQNALASLEVPCWLDLHDIELGQPLARAIETGIRDSAAVCFWINDGFLRSNWCRFEFESFLHKYASQPNVTLISLVESDCTARLPPTLQTIKYREIEAPFDYLDISSRIKRSLERSTKEPRLEYWS